MIAPKKKQNKTQNKALGDDPLSWMKDEEEAKDNAESIKSESKGMDDKQTANTIAETIDEEQVKDSAESPGSESRAVAEKQTANTVNETAEQTLTQIEPPSTGTEAIATESVNDNNLVLDPVLSIAEVAALNENLQALFKNDEDVSIDASQVHMIDTAGLQLLLVLKMELQKHHRNISWPNPSPVFLETAELLGLSEPLGLHT